MKEILYKCSVFLLLIIALFPSCNNVRKENNDKLVTEMIDSLNVHRENQNGRAMILILDSLKSFDIKILPIAQKRYHRRVVSGTIIALRAVPPVSL